MKWTFFAEFKGTELTDWAHRNTKDGKYTAHKVEVTVRKYHEDGFTYPSNNSVKVFWYGIKPDGKRNQRLTAIDYNLTKDVGELLGLPPFVIEHLDERP